MKQKNFAKYFLAVGLLSLAAFSAQAAQDSTTISQTQKSTMIFKNDEEKVSYIIGHQIATSIRNDDLKVNKVALIKAIEEGLAGKNSELSAQETQSFMQKYLTGQQKIRGDKNTKEGDAFLAKTKHESGVVTLASGLQYKIMTKGTGAKPKATDTVTVEYEGTLVDGKIFDSSYQRGQPVSFPVNGVIKGWTEALQLMPEGSTWMLYVPANLAYGAQAPSPLIGPNSALIFKVHLVSIAKPAASAATSTAKPAEEKKP
ncbi:MAG: FKBP-type peptidyl-prolyl cis-trans isomerase [Bdellovibrionota bacterium]